MANPLYLVEAFDSFDTGFCVDVQIHGASPADAARAMAIRLWNEGWHELTRIMVFPAGGPCSELANAILDTTLGYRPELPAE